MNLIKANGMNHTLAAAVLLAVVALALPSSPAMAGENPFILKVIEKEPPAELSEEIRAAIVPKVYQLSDADGLFFEIWFAKEMPARELVDSQKKTLDSIEGVSLMGAVHVHVEERYDFRDDPIDPGVFTMRMGLQPQDGNHMGTAPFDTFAILLPADKDTTLAGFSDHEMMIEVSSEDTVAEHPPIFSVQPLEKAEGEFPYMSRGGDDWFFLNLELPLKVDGKSGSVRVQLVFDGIGDV